MSPASVRASSLANGAGSSRTPSTSPSARLGDHLFSLFAQHAAHGVEEAAAVAHPRRRPPRDRDLQAPRAGGDPPPGARRPISGRRRSVPTPEHGASTTTTSYPSGTLAGPGCPVRCVGRADARARWARAELGELVWVDVARVDRAARARPPCASSQVLLPCPAHASRTRSPGRAPAKSVTTCAPSSWMIHALPAPGRRRTSPAPRTRIARGDTAPAAIVAPGAAAASAATHASRSSPFARQRPIGGGTGPAAR